MGSGLGFGAYGGTGGSSRRERLLFSATNKRLKNAIDQMYRPGALVGDGGLADAIRYEKVTGESVGGRSHFLKGKQRLRNLENILAKEILNAQDAVIVKSLIDDLRQALEEE